MVVALSGYSAYFDASMDKEKTEMLVAGYVSTLEEWSQFEISWKLTLAKYDVPFFKMSEFIGRRKEYPTQSGRLNPTGRNSFLICRKSFGAGLRRA